MPVCMGSGQEIRLTNDGNSEGWTAVDVETGVASDGPTREAALENLDDAVGLHHGEHGRPVTDADLKALGVDPETVPDEPQVPDAPWFDN